MQIPTKMMALVSRQGTACAETAICNICYEDDDLRTSARYAGRGDISDIDNDAFVDCTPNDALQCVCCGRGATTMRQLLDSAVRRLDEVLSQEVIYLDMPPMPGEDSWRSIGQYPRTPEGQSQAVEYIREHIGPCDDYGRVPLLTNLLTCPGQEEVRLSTGLDLVEVPRLDGRELATVLAAMRYWQSRDTQRTTAQYYAMVDIATDEGQHLILDDNEIDALCERLNCGSDKPLRVVMSMGGGCIQNMDIPKGVEVEVFDFDEEEDPEYTGSLWHADGKCEAISPTDIDEFDEDGDEDEDEECDE